jgi:hypothetical protein
MAEALLDAMDRAVPPATTGDVWRYASYRQYMGKYTTFSTWLARSRY